MRITSILGAQYSRDGIYQHTGNLNGARGGSNIQMSNSTVHGKGREPIYEWRYVKQ